MTKLELDVLMDEQSANRIVTGELPKLFVLGDSISMHYGPFLATQLKGICSYERKVAPVGGETADLDEGKGANGGDSSMVLAYLERRLAEPVFRPDVLLLNCGLHDVKTDPETGARQIPNEAYRANLMKIVSLLERHQTRMIWVRTTHCNDAIHNARSTNFRRYIADIEAYNSIADEIMTVAGIRMLDLHHFSRNLGEDHDLFLDHVHFQPAVCMQQAAFIAGAITTLLV